MHELRRLAELAGISATYNDVHCNLQTVDDETLAFLLNALGLSCATPEECMGSADILHAERTLTLPPVKALLSGRHYELSVAGALNWHLHSEHGDHWEGEAKHEIVSLPPLAMGYHTLEVKRAQDMLTCRIIAAPATCWQPDAVIKGKRAWGLSTQLYALRSEANWGLGDFGDLQKLAGSMAELGMDVIGLSPLHALFLANPAHFAPYSPSNRAYLNALYIDVAQVKGFKRNVKVQKLFNDPSFQDELRTARDAELIDYPLVAKLKLRVLNALFNEAMRKDLPEAFHRFREEGGEGLRLQTLFDALADHFAQAEGHLHWRRWPEAFHNPGSQEVARFAEEHAGRVTFYAWLQWLADGQLAEAQATALQGGATIGLYRDLAVGSDSSGAEVWTDQDRFLRGVTVGAPPDEYNPSGQNWGLPPLNPYVLRAQGYGPFIQLLRANMRHAGALRIDHAFALKRLFLIPEGMKADKGAYLDYPFEEMLAVVKLESHRNRCMVIGEDLGTFPPGYRLGAAEAGLLSYKLFYFEHTESGAFMPPRYYPKQALATLSTHDLPTFAGWLKARDIDEKERLGIYPSTALAERDRRGRARDKPFLAEALQAEGLDGGDDSLKLMQGVQRLLARSAAAIVMVQLEDILGVETQANLPATTTERPNWRIKLPETIESIFAKEGELARLSGLLKEERSKSPSRLPRATYRLQFHKDFTFQDAARIIPYLAKLGVSHVYASPYLSARPGSTHGYDITDHNTLNPELGGTEGFAVFTQALEAGGMEHILDFVPNHMGIGGCCNAWWLSVLEWGEESPYADYFDIDWKPRMPGIKPKLLVPFLGEHYGESLQAGKLKLTFDATNGGFDIWYGEHRFPVCPADYAMIDERAGDARTFAEGESRRREIAQASELHAEFNSRADAITQDKPALHALLERQHYRLAFWRTASSDINYRRFFDINDLAGMRVEKPEVFNAMHRFVLAEVAAGTIQGLRIDHIDGLADPEAYCRRLRERIGTGAYLTVEKILIGQEPMPVNWEIEGTSGYDALSLMGNLFVARRNEKAMDRVYRHFTGLEQSLEDMIFAAKVLILETSLASELQSLSYTAKRIAEQSPYDRDYTVDSLIRSLKDIIGRFPVYRTYVTPNYSSARDLALIAATVAKAKAQSSLTDLSVYDFLGRLLTLGEAENNVQKLAFARRFQQISGPVMAKGVEDTVFYRFNRLLSLNEVGSGPERFGMALAEFHRIQALRAQLWPHSMLATATHDTKRGEDMRMRLHVLSEIPAEWGSHLARWAKINKKSRAQEGASHAPSRNEEYFIYQTLLGSWPVEWLERKPDEEGMQAYLKRLDEYLVKALREAKVNSSWNNPNEAYEKAVSAFLHAILGASHGFLDAFMPLAARLAQTGMVNSLSQLTLKMTLPGVPDIYQGTENWDLNLVDPDNRRPVDYGALQARLEQPQPLAELLQNWTDARVKQQLLHRLLTHRAQNPALYANGDYRVLQTDGKYAKNILAYLRSYEGQVLIIIVPLQIAGLGEKNFLPIGEFWGDTSVILPFEHSYTSILDGSLIDGGTVLLSRLLEKFPLLSAFSVQPVSANQNL